MDTVFKAILRLAYFLILNNAIVEQHFDNLPALAEEKLDIPPPPLITGVEVDEPDNRSIPHVDQQIASHPLDVCNI